MSAASPLAQEQTVHSVESILTELLDGYARQADLREDLIAKGVPVPTIQMLVELAKSGPETEFQLLKEKTLQLAQQKYGLKAVSAKQLEDNVEGIMRLDEDIHFVRKMARDMNLDPQAINMLTQIVLRNPGDRGVKVLSSLLEYASACSINVEGLRLLESAPEAAQSVLPQIDIQEPELNGLMKYREVLIELALGIVVTVTALSLLT